MRAIKERPILVLCEIPRLVFKSPRVMLPVFGLLTTLLLISCTSSKHPYGVSKLVSKKENLSIQEKDLAGRTPKTYILQLVSTLDTLFEDNYDPYTGTNTLPEECRKPNLPERVSSSSQVHEMRLISLYSSKNKLVGQCPIEEKKLKTQYLILFCKGSKRLFVAKYFYSDQSPWITEPVIYCQ